MIFAAAYLLWALQRIIFNPLGQARERVADRPHAARAGGAGAAAGRHRLARALSRSRSCGGWSRRRRQLRGDASSTPSPRALRRIAAPPPRVSREPDRPDVPMGVTLALLPEVVLTARGARSCSSSTPGGTSTAADSRLAGWLACGGRRGLAAWRSPGSWRTAPGARGHPAHGRARRLPLRRRAALPARRRGHHPPVARLPRARAAAGAGVLPAGPARHDRDDAAGRGQRPHHGLPRPRGDVGGGVRPGRLTTAAAASPRRRPSSTSSSARSPRASCSTASRWSTAPPAPPTSCMAGTCFAGGPNCRCMAAPRPRPAADRLRVQGGGRAVPHVGARRVRRRAHAGHGLHGHRGQGGGVRRADPAPLRRLPGASPSSGSRSSAILAILTMVAGNLDGAGPAARSSGCWPTAPSRTPATCSRRSGRGTRLGARGRAALPPRLPPHHAGGVRRCSPRSERVGERDVTADDLAGLARARPWTAVAFAVCLLSLLGFPGTFGFIGKWMILIVARGRRPVAACPWCWCSRASCPRATTCRSSWRCT